ncbi:outer-membrane lipoprotein carrier protein [Thiosulfatimonas sediminis]|uniref:Outer-membrane lipoprotein carrier protein n=1 Tax=Thiosulfatimonas sediminis TaxID=2675054 RepID=A0A6F8PTZ9_9GAMM|nr:outer-membrane lipoprotein carrier protein LolA [Thiosulfatimonas sediminis]BBP45576.1 outer-membrane lipoprotein carrier protein [Thiosulfatimonas sediminis]
MLLTLKKSLLVASGLFCLSWNAFAQANPLQDFVNSLHTFEANFAQQTLEDSPFSSANPPKTGHFQLLRPGKLVWEYSAKDAQRIVVDGQNLWVLDKDLEQVTVRPIAEVQADIPLSWLLYDEKIQDKFTIIFAGERQGMVWYNLTPKAATYFQSIEVGLKAGVMQQVLMYEGPENITKINFSQVQINQPIAPQNFEFTLPQDLDVIGQPSER